MRTVHALLFAFTLIPACGPKTGADTSTSTQSSGHTGTGTSGDAEGEGDGTSDGTTSNGTGEETSGPDPKLDMPEATSSTSGSTSGSTGTGPNGDCGNGTIDEGEQCDGPDLGGIGCKDLGYPDGVLMCDPVICTFDTSNCLPDPSTTTSG